VISCVSTGFIPAAGSSSRSSRGFVAVARAISSRRRFAYESHQPLPEEREALLGEALDFLLLAPHSRRAHDRAEDARARVRPRGRHDVLLHRHVQEQAERLERACDPARGDLVRLEPEQRLVLEEDVAVVRPVHAGDEVEERRLAGAVRADDADDLTLGDVQVEILDHGEPAEALRDVPQLEHQTISTRDVPSSPCGRAFMRTMRMTPIRMSRVMLGSTTSRLFQTNAAR
jgi:hypothetical protein